MGAADAGLIDQQSMQHLDRISGICDAMARHPAWGDAERLAAFDRLLTFDQDYWTFTRYLSLPLYQETQALLLQREPIGQAPQIAVVMAVHRPQPELLRLSLISALNQVGVISRVHLSLDGPEGNLPLVEELLAELDPNGTRVTVRSQPENRGVGLCRNAALADCGEAWFTVLDPDDIFHPLRLLHAWLAKHELSVTWLNTGCSRVNLRQRKIILVQNSISSTGYNSFIADRSVLDRYGYLAPLRF